MDSDISKLRLQNLGEREEVSVNPRLLALPIGEWWFCFVFVFALLPESRSRMGLVTS